MKPLKWVGFIFLILLALLGLSSLFKMLTSSTGTTLFGGSQTADLGATAFAPNTAMLSTNQYAEAPRKMAYGMYSPTNTRPRSPNKQRKIIKNADLSLEVKKIENTVKVISTLITSYQGYIASSHYSKDNIYQGPGINGGPSASMVLRVPAESLTTVLMALKKLAINVTRESISTDDITKRYFDLKSKLSHLEAAASQLNLLLSKAIKVEDKLAIFTVLSQKEKTINILKSQINYYNKAVSLSKITVTLSQPIVIKQKAARDWSMAPVIKLAFQSLLNSLSNLLNTLIYFLIYILPLLLIWSVIVYIGYYIFSCLKNRIGGRHE